jgi:hypothetical protein
LARSGSVGGADFRFLASHVLTQRDRVQFTATLRKLGEHKKSGYILTVNKKVAVIVVTAGNVP